MNKHIALMLRALCAFFAATVYTAQAQIDPEPRQLLHLGVNAPLEGNGPKGAYAFYYWNMPGVPTSNQVLRLVIAPTYVDGELGFKSLIGPNTDFAVGAAGGAFANSYEEVRHGYHFNVESFDGYSGGLSASIYHLFNPAGRVPLSGILRETVTYNSWTKKSDTADNFDLPDNQPILTTRLGLRWGGKEPVLWPTLAMELSAWYEIDKRTDAGGYGFSNDRRLNNTPQRVFARALLHFTTFHDQHYVVLALQGGAAFDSDRLSAFRLGGMLSYTKEFTLRIPGYYFQEISARDYGQAFGLYAIPFGSSKSWKVMGGGGLAVVRYEEGLGQRGAFNSGALGGLAYSRPSGRWKIMSAFGYGFQAERTHGRGGYTLGGAFQYNFGKTTFASDEAYEQMRAEEAGKEHSPVGR